MILRGATIHRDGHGKCGLLSAPFHFCLTPYRRSFIRRPPSTLQQHASPYLDFGTPSLLLRRHAQPHRHARPGERTYVGGT